MRNACLLLLAVALLTATGTAGAQDTGFAETAPPKVNVLLETMPEETSDAPPAAPVDEKTEDTGAKIAEIGALMRESAENPADTTGENRATTVSETRPPREGMLLRGIMSLLVTLALILLIYAGIKRWGRKTPMLAGQSLGNVMGRLALTPHASLHFVRTNDEVLIVGVTQQAVSLLRTFEAADFEATTLGTAADPTAQATPSESTFLAQLKEAQGSLGMPGGVDEELDLLKGDLQRLKQYFQDSTRAEE